jgi:hypothetical protein
MAGKGVRLLFGLRAGNGIPIMLSLWQGNQEWMRAVCVYCTYYRIANRTMNVADGVHSVKFTLTDRDIDKESVLK